MVQGWSGGSKCQIKPHYESGGSQTPTGGVVQFNKVNVSEPKPFYGVRDAKALENFIFDLEQYFWATNTVAEEVKVTIKNEK